jgi:rhodanese-related sulfurtransferase
MPTIIDRDRVAQLVADGAQLVEVLDSREYAEEHLQGADNLPLAELSAASAARFDRERPIIVYCHDLE